MYIKIYLLSRTIDFSSMIYFVKGMSDDDQRLPVFGNIRFAKGPDSFTLRGEVKVTIQWMLYWYITLRRSVATDLRMDNNRVEETKNKKKKEKMIEPIEQRN